MCAAVDQNVDGILRRISRRISGFARYFFVDQYCGFGLIYDGLFEIYRAYYYAWFRVDLRNRRYRNRNPPIDPDNGVENADLPNGIPHIMADD